MGPNSRRRLERKRTKISLWSGLVIKQFFFDFIHQYHRGAIRSRIARLNPGPFYLRHQNFGAGIDALFSYPPTSCPKTTRSTLWPPGSFGNQQQPQAGFWIDELCLSSTLVRILIFYLGFLPGLVDVTL